MPTPQDYVDALRNGEYLLALDLAKLVYDRYRPLNNGEILGADDVTPLMASLLAETDLTFNDIAMIQQGIFSLDTMDTQEQKYYLTQIMSAASTLLSHEAWLKQQEGNQDKSPQEIRQMVRDEVAEAIKGCEDPKKEGAKVVAKTTILEMSQEMVVLVEKEKTHQKVLAYAMDHLIKENVEQIRETGKLLSDYLNKIEADIEALDRESNKLEVEVKGLLNDLNQLNTQTDTLSSGNFSARKKELDDNIGLGQNRLKEIVKLRREAYNRKIMTESQLSIFITHLAQLKDNQHDHITTSLKKITNARRETSAKETLSWLPDEKSLSKMQQQIESYLDFLDNNPVENPDKNPRLLKVYMTRKGAAENMLIIVKTTSLRTSEKTLDYLQDNIKTIENNRPGLLELGFIAWVKNFFKQFKSEMAKTTDETLTSTQSELKTLRENFVGQKKAFKAIKDGPEKDVANDPKNQSLPS